MFRQEKLTCPFTGGKFKAVFNDDNTVSISNPLSGVSYNFKIMGGAITIPLELFDYVDLVTLKEASEILEVSLQRISAIAKNGTIPTYRIGDKTIFKLSDVLRYKQMRKVGNPHNKE